MQILKDLLAKLGVGAVKNPVASTTVGVAIFVLMREVGSWGDADEATAYSVTTMALAAKAIWDALLGRAPAVEPKAE